MWPGRCDIPNHMPPPGAGVKPSGRSLPEMGQGYSLNEERAARLLSEEGQVESQRQKPQMPTLASVTLGYPIDRSNFISP